LIIKKLRSSKLKRIGSLLIFITSFYFAATARSAELHFTAQVNKNEVSIDENVILQLVLSTDSNTNDEEEPRLPNLDGFELLNKWSQNQSSSVFENGQFKFERKFIYNYTLAPQKKGTLLIGPAEMRVAGQVLKSQPIRISVLDAGTGKVRKKPADEDDQQNSPFGDDDDNDLFTQLLRRRGLGVPGGRGSRPSTPGIPQPGAPSTTSSDVSSKDVFFIAVEVNKRKAFVGEEVIASWYLYTRGSLQGFDALKYPELKGFWKEDLEMATRLNFQPAIVNGIPYNKALLVSYALFPISAGPKLIDAYQAKGTVIQMDSPMAMFGIGQPFNITKSSKEIPIEVSPLPTAGQPASFSGAVGRFSVTGSLGATQVKVNQPVSLKIRFTGEGNVKAIELPTIDLPKNLDLYDTKKDSKFQKNGEGYKEFELLIVPRSEGKITIPPIAVSYFDPKTEKYVSTQTPAFPLTVLPGDPTNPSNIAPPIAAKPLTESPNSPPEDIRYLKTQTLFALPPAEEKLLWLIAFLTVYLAFGIQIWRSAFGQDGSAAAEIRKRVKLKLEAARNLLKKQDWRGVGVECTNALLTTLGEVSGGGAGRPAQELLAGLPPEAQKLSDAIQKFLSRCEVLSFAPKEMAQSMGQSEIKKLIGEAEKIIGKLLEISKSEKPAAQNGEFAGA
jgi:hypothetical protein